MKNLKNKPAEIQRTNKSLKLRFKELKLDVTDVWSPMSDDLELENSQLLHLLDWVIAYRKTPDRAVLEKKGYEYPPIEPDMDPNNDWLIFETWLQGKPITWKYEDTFGSIPPVDDFTDQELKDNMSKILDQMAERGVYVTYEDNVPLKLAYSDLRNCLQKEEYTILAPGTISHQGCLNFCPECVQRPWCEMGQDVLEAWLEDDEAGTMVIPDVCKPYMDNTAEHLTFEAVK